MIAMTICIIIGLVVVITVCVGIGFVIGSVTGILMTVDEIMDDPYLRAATLRSLSKDDEFYIGGHLRREFIKGQVHDKL